MVFTLDDFGSPERQKNMTSLYLFFDITPKQFLGGSRQYKDASNTYTHLR